MCLTETVTFQDLCDYMLDSKVWQTKERLFTEAFPTVEERRAYFAEQVGQLLREYKMEGKPIEDLNDLLVRKLAIDFWFSRVPRSLLKNVDLSE